MDWASIRKVGRHLSSVRSALGANNETIPASWGVGYRRNRVTTVSAPSPPGDRGLKACYGLLCESLKLIHAPIVLLLDLLGQLALRCAGIPGPGRLDPPLPRQHLQLGVGRDGGSRGLAGVGLGGLLAEGAVEAAVYTAQ